MAIFEITKQGEWVNKSTLHNTWMTPKYLMSLQKISIFQDIQKPKVKKKILGQKSKGLFSQYTKISKKCGTSRPFHD